MCWPDLRDLTSRLLRTLDGRGEPAALAQPPEQAIVVAEDLSPSQTASLDRSRVAALPGPAVGGPTAYSAILARSMGIPAVVGMGDKLLAQVHTGMAVAIDGGAAHSSSTPTIKPSRPLPHSAGSISNT